MDFDYIICGGGSAGCVLANRLSADSSNNVLLIEAGKDTPPEKVPAAILDSYPFGALMNPAFKWPGLTVKFNKQTPRRPYEQGRIMGGSSSINAQLANRGAPADYEEWVKIGAVGWGWDDVLPYFRKLENDLDFDGPFHGTEGPMLTRRIFPENWPGFASGAAEAFKEQGYSYQADQNAEFGDGYSPIAISNAYDRRISVAMAYLGPNVRLRKNLHIMATTEVQRIAFDRKKAIGVYVKNGAGEKLIKGREIIISTGALQSPAILMRSGIGPEKHLNEMGIEVVAPLEGVGQNLCEHPGFAVSTFLKPEARQEHSMRRHFHVALRYTSDVEDTPETDMMLATISKAAWHSVGQRLGAFLIWVYKPYSRGEVRLASTDASVPPVVDFNLLSDERDLARMVDGVARVAKFFDSHAMKACSSEPFPSSFSARVRRISTPTKTNAFLTGILGWLLDGPNWLRKLLINKVITEGKGLDAIRQSEPLLKEEIRKKVMAVWHVSGTCRMGHSDDSLAVTDTQGRVHSIEGLRVVDASIMPSLPRANTNYPTIMIAEKISDCILKS